MHRLWWASKNNLVRFWYRDITGLHAGLECLLKSSCTVKSYLQDWHATISNAWIILASRALLTIGTKRWPLGQAFFSRTKRVSCSVVSFCVWRHCGLSETKQKEASHSFPNRYCRSLTVHSSSGRTGSKTCRASGPGTMLQSTVVCVAWFSWQIRTASSKTQIMFSLRVLCRNTFIVLIYLRWF